MNFLKQWLPWLQVLESPTAVIEDNPWLEEPPVAKTLGDEGGLPYPDVGEPDVTTVPDFPSYLALEVTNVCNLECTHCNYRFGVSHYTRDRGYVEPDVVEKVLQEAKKYNAMILMNYDGEPLMNKHHIDYLRRATEIGVKTYFNTNGTLFNKKYVDQLVEFYQGSIFFSLDGDREWYEKIRLKGDYDVVLENLNYFLQENEKKGWPITIGVSLCNLGQEAEGRKKFLETWLPRVNYISMGEVNDKYGTMISDPMTILKIKKRPVCVVPWQTLGVCHNGDIIPCSIYVTRANTANAIFGNVRNDSLYDIWHNKQFEEFRKMLSEKRNESYCSKCERWRSQFVFPITEKDGLKVERNGYWTTYHNTRLGQLNFKSR